jgi:hypothetical protein
VESEDERTKSISIQARESPSDREGGREERGGVKARRRDEGRRERDEEET